MSLVNNNYWGILTKITFTSEARAREEVVVVCNEDIALPTKKSHSWENWWRLVSEAAPTTRSRLCFLTSSPTPLPRPIHELPKTSSRVRVSRLMHGPKLRRSGRTWCHTFTKLHPFQLVASCHWISCENPRPVQKLLTQTGLALCQKKKKQLSFFQKKTSFKKTSKDFTLLCIAACRVGISASRAKEVSQRLPLAQVLDTML